MFIDFDVVNFRYIGGDDELGWWRKSELLEHMYLSQAQALAKPWLTTYLGSKDSLHNDGVWVTLNALWQRRGNLAKQVNVLKAGLLFSILDSSRNYYHPLLLPPRDKLVSLQTQVHEAAGIEQSPWAHYHTCVLPVCQYDKAYVHSLGFHSGKDYRDLLTFMLELERMVGAVMKEWQPVRVRYAADKAEADKLLARFNASPEKRAADKLVAEERQLAQQQAMVYAARQRAEAGKLSALREKHPCFGQWPPAPAKVKELVWTSPITEVAKLFGVSDTAIRKYCDRHDIERPPQGYWLSSSVSKRVEPGRL